MPPQAVHCIRIDTILDESSTSIGGTSDTNDLRQQTRPSQSRFSDCLQFSLDGHKDVVQCILPLPNGDVVTAGGKYDATTQVWSQSQLQKAAAITGEERGDDDNVDSGNGDDNGNDYDNGNGNGNGNDNSTRIIYSTPPILTMAATTNLCKEAGYVFAMELLKDFKSKSNGPRNKKQVDDHFAIAVARYNVVKIAI